MTDRRPDDGEELEAVNGSKEPESRDEVEAEVEAAEIEAEVEAAEIEAEVEAAEVEAEVEAAEELDTAPTSARLSGPITPAVVPEAKARAAAAADDHPYIDDRVSKIWVALILAVFAGILLFGILFGKAGMLNPASPSPSPAPSVTSSPSPSLGPSTSPTGSPSASPSSAPSVSPSTGSPSPSTNPSPTSAPSASPTAT